ncbi:MAG: protein BatD [Candidatus Latescibacteria bacterium]|nr:protein BatD [Candidatus Latescibacterota bacterium]
MSRALVCVSVFVLLVACGVALAESPRLRVSVDRSRVEVGEQVTLTVTLTAGGDVPEPELPVPEAFDVIGRSSYTSQEINITNGRVVTTRNNSYVYTLKARREGSFVIGPAHVLHEGRRHESTKVRVNVTKRSGRPRTRPVPAPGPDSGVPDVDDLKADLFIATTVDKRKVYVGEQVTVTYKLYTRRTLRNISYGRLPAYTGFWSETLFDAQRARFDREVYNGREFNVMRLKTMALFPTASGVQSLDVLEVVCQVQERARRRNLFDMDDFFGFGASREVRARSEDVKIEVSPLPAGAPPGFSGAVGRFDVSVDASPVDVRTGDPIAVKVQVRGTGNLNAVGEPVRPEGDAFKFYDPNSTVNSGDSDGRIGGEKTFEYVAIPNRAGSGRIGPFLLAYFDPEEQRYRTARSPVVSVNVAPGMRQAASGAVMNRKEIEMLGKDIRHLKPDLGYLEDHGRPYVRSTWFWTIQLVPVLGFFGMLAYKRHRDRLMADVAYARRRRSGPEARKRLTQARKQLHEKDGVAFYVEIDRALGQFLANRLNLPVAGITRESAAQALREKDVPDPIVSQVQDVFLRCDYARFASVRIPEKEREEIFNAAAALIDALGARI